MRSSEVDQIQKQIENAVRKGASDPNTEHTQPGSQEGGALRAWLGVVRVWMPAPFLTAGWIWFVFCLLPAAF